MSKRLLDFVVAATGLLLLAPLMAVIALAIRMGSPGPVLYRQTRVGLAGKPFKILKFRSMSHAGASGAVFREITVGADPRITRAGAFLRRTKLDELPQLLNVLLGEMSLVGPRPEVPRYVERYPPDARREVLSVRPGITDEASIEFRNESELLARSSDPELTYVEEILPRKLEHHRQYIRSRSLAGDVGIILRTLGRIASGN